MLAENVLRKHVSIIHAYSMMSSLQRKIFNVLLHRAINYKNSQNGSTAVECMMPMSELINSVKFNSNNTQYLKESVDTLASIKIEWNLLKDRVPSSVSFLNLRVLHGSPTFYENGTFNFSFHKFMLSFVGSPDIYGTIDINLQAEFESKYGHSLYENSTRFANMEKEKIIQIKTFRKLLGVSEKKYATMRELTRNVIKPAVEEVNDRAGFIVDLQPLSIGRKVTGFQLKVNLKQKFLHKKYTIADDNTQKILDEITRYFGKISASVLDNILKNYSHEYIYQKINYTKKYVNKDKTGFYPIAYFISAIKNNYQRSDQSVNNNEQLKENDINERWYHSLRELNYDLNHWKRLLRIVSNSKNTRMKESYENIIKNSEDKLKKHLLQKPNIIKNSEAN